MKLQKETPMKLLEKMKNGLVECSIIRTPFNPEGLTCVYGNHEPFMAVGEVRIIFPGLPILR